MSSIIKVDTIQLADGTAGTIENLGLATGALSHRNLIINGDMRIAQRGTSKTGLQSNGYYEGADRMRRSGSGLSTLVATREQSTDAPDGFGYSLKETITTAETADSSDAYRPLTYRIEGQDLQHLKYGTSDAKDLTLSFWIKSSVTGTYSITFLSYYDGSNSDKITTTYSIDSANTWEYKTITIPGNTNASIRNTNEYGMIIMWCAGCGSDWLGTDTTSWADHTSGDASGYHYGQTASVHTTLNATWQITGVQLEVGSVATPFEHRSYAEELLRCQRYFYAMDGGSHYGAAYGNGGNAFVFQALPVVMRTDPTLSYSSIGGGATANTDYTNKYRIQQYLSDTDYAASLYNIKVDAEL